MSKKIYKKYPIRKNRIGYCVFFKALLLKAWLLKQGTETKVKIGYVCFLVFLGDGKFRILDTV